MTMNHRKTEKKKKIISELWDNIKQLNICRIRISENNRNKGEPEKEIKVYRHATLNKPDPI